jgi:hypothetical protein
MGWHLGTGAILTLTFSFSYESESNWKERINKMRSTYYVPIQYISVHDVLHKRLVFGK